MPVIKEQVVQIFCAVSGFILLITGAAKLVSCFGTASILDHGDPFFGYSFRQLMCIAGMCEVVIGGWCLLKYSTKFKIVALAWLSSILILYRLGLWSQGWEHHCPCLGNLTDYLRISPTITDSIMGCILTLLALGSYVSLALYWFEFRKPTLSPSNER
jgi:hypothetical protein